MQLDASVSAVITGGASGLGEASARALAAKGVKVAIFDLNAEKGEKVAGEIGGTYCQADVTSDESIDAAFAKARAGERVVPATRVGGGNVRMTVEVAREVAEFSLPKFIIRAAIVIVE